MLAAARVIVWNWVLSLISRWWSCSVLAILCRNMINSLLCGQVATLSLTLSGVQLSLKCRGRLSVSVLRQCLYVTALWFLGNLVYTPWLTRLLGCCRRSAVVVGPISRKAYRELRVKKFLATDRTARSSLLVRRWVCLSLMRVLLILTVALH